MSGSLFQIFDDDEAVNRLTEIKTDEVSIVDRAANQRKFLIVKRQEGDASTEAASQAKQAPTKTEDGVQFPAAAYAFTPDGEKPSTWKLRLFDAPGDVPSKPSVRLTAAAAQALTSTGFRGQPVQLPEDARAGVKSKVAAAWLKARADRDVSRDDLPTILKSEESTVTTTELNKTLVYARLDEALGRVEALKGALDGAPSTTDAEKGYLPPEVGHELRSVQFMLKGLAGTSRLMLSHQADLSNLPAIRDGVKKDATEILDEVHRRLTALKGDLGEASMLDSGQARRVDGVADLLAKTLYSCPASKALVVIRSSLSDAQRPVVLAAVEKAMEGLGVLLVGLQTDAVVKGDVADQFAVASVMHDHAELLERAVASVLTEKGEGREIDAAVESLRALDTLETPGEDSELPADAVEKAREVAATLSTLISSYSTVAKVEPGEEDLTALAAALGLEPQPPKEAKKVGRPMKATRLNRLKNVTKLFKEAVADLKGGSASLEKFKKIAAVLGSLITELQVEKASQVNQGITDTRGVTQDAPNMGSGVQPDTTVVAGVEAVAGEGTPSMDAILKEIQDLKKENAKLGKRVTSRDAEVAKLKKRRAAPSSPPEDAGRRPKEVSKVDQVVWPADLNELPSLKDETRR